MTECARERVAGSIAPCFWKRAAAGREHDNRRVVRITVGRADHESAIAPLNTRDPARDMELGMRIFEGPDERVKHAARTIGVREQFAAFFLVKRHAELFEPVTFAAMRN